MINPAPLLPMGGGVFLGWSLGANDAANVFGTAVAARIITFRKACIICGLAVILGAWLQGEAGIHTLAKLSNLTPEAPAGQIRQMLLIISLAAALTTTIMTAFRLPVSASQAVVGAVLGVGLVVRNVDWAILGKVITCWLATPIGAMLIACVVYRLLGWFIRKAPMSMLTRDKILWSGLLVMGVYGSYALGANNVANATGIFSGQFAETGITDAHLALIGGAAIAAGAISFSKRIMLAVGSGIMPLDAFTALVAVCAMSITVHIFAVIGVPVSTSQAIVGAIIGIGMMQGFSVIHGKKLANITLGWIITPTAALILAAAGYAIFLGKAN
ncbi:inorganic phosphate transporter [Planctomycetota bacterium]